ncbi:MAG: tRNA pseudouridine(54/55) synthase Pus10 [Thermoplasmata archaeon]|nr:MAG: tRNA pseudouridine(54/55) synthase Pus10 [Thermoplasmata archaeon]
MRDHFHDKQLCKDCYSRLIGCGGYGIKRVLKAEDCWICRGLSQEIGKFVDLSIEAVEQYQFETFGVGTKVDDEILERDEEVRHDLGVDGRDIKTWINRRIGRELEKRSGKKFVFSNYDINIIVDTRFDHITLQVTPVYVYGRYIKLVRGIPQTKWPCRTCKGVGCRRCRYTGKQYMESVEEIISRVIVEWFEGDDESFHGCGREDIDARMLGTGRPFVVEVKNPKKRKVDLKALEKEINKYANRKVMVRGLRYSDKDEIVRIKNESYTKVYHAKIACEENIQEKRLKDALSFLEGKIIKQQTPTRVSHRRADKVREKKIYECKLIWAKEKEALIKIRAESGTYIKELVSGDEGRTKPSLSEVLQSRCEVKELDVISVEGD